jgi:hypothetical protein
MNVVDEVTGLLLLSTTATSSGTGAGQTPSPPPQQQQQQQQPPFDVTSSSGREALLLRFLQLLPSTLDLQQPLNQPSPTMNGTSSASEAETTSRACQQLVSEVVTALRLWVMQQPLTLGRPLGDDNPSLFALLRPQLRQLHWWRAPQGHAVASSSSSVAPPHYPTSAASPPPEPPVGVRCQLSSASTRFLVVVGTRDTKISEMWGKRRPHSRNFLYCPTPDWCVVPTQAPHGVVPLACASSTASLSQISAFLAQGDDTVMPHSCW